MVTILGYKNSKADLSNNGLDKVKQFWNRSPAALEEKKLILGQGQRMSLSFIKNLIKDSLDKR